MPVSVYMYNGPFDKTCPDGWAQGHLADSNDAPLCGKRLDERWELFRFSSAVDEALCPACASLRGPAPTEPDESEFNTWLYIINLRGTDYYKIGISKNVRTRLSSLQGGSPIPLKLHWQAGRYVESDARDLENELHQRFYQFRVKVQGQREWFRLSVNQIDEIKRLVDDASE